MRGTSTISIFVSLVKRIYKVFYHAKIFKPDLMVGSDASVAIVGSIFSVHRITIIEDDYSVIKILGDLTYPFTETILCPNVCDVGKWNYKKVGCNGYMKLAYLHPNIFNEEKNIVKKYNLPNKFAIIRLSQLAAYHDKYVDGLNHKFLIEIIDILEKHSINVFITAETQIDKFYSKYLLKINPNDIHQVLAQSSILISDSQSMSVEASILEFPQFEFQVLLVKFLF